MQDNSRASAYTADVFKMIDSENKTPQAKDGMKSIEATLRTHSGLIFTMHKSFREDYARLNSKMDQMMDEFRNLRGYLKRAVSSKEGIVAKDENEKEENWRSHSEHLLQLNDGQRKKEVDRLMLVMEMLKLSNAEAPGTSTTSKLSQARSLLECGMAANDDVHFDRDSVVNEKSLFQIDLGQQKASISLGPIQGVSASSVDFGAKTPLSKTVAEMSSTGSGRRNDPVKQVTGWNFQKLSTPSIQSTSVFSAPSPASSAFNAPFLKTPLAKTAVATITTAEKVEQNDAVKQEAGLKDQKISTPLAGGFSQPLHSAVISSRTPLLKATSTTVSTPIKLEQAGLVKKEPGLNVEKLSTPVKEKTNAVAVHPLVVKCSPGKDLVPVDARLPKQELSLDKSTSAPLQLQKNEEKAKEGSVPVEKADKSPVASSATNIQLIVAKDSSVPGNTTFFSSLNVTSNKELSVNSLSESRRDESSWNLKEISTPSKADTTAATEVAGDESTNKSCGKPLSQLSSFSKALDKTASQATKTTGFGIIESPASSTFPNQDQQQLSAKGISFLDITDEGKQGQNSFAVGASFPSFGSMSPTPFGSAGLGPLGLDSEKKNEQKPLKSLFGGGFQVASSTVSVPTATTQTNVPKFGGTQFGSTGLQADQQGRRSLFGGGFQTSFASLATNATQAGASFLNTTSSQTTFGGGNKNFQVFRQKGASSGRNDSSANLDMED